MPLALLVVALCTLGLSAWLESHASAFAQSAQPRVREIPWDPSTPIASRLLPDDEVVVITPLEGGLTVSPGRKLTTNQVIEDLAVRADVVAVIDIETVEGVLWRQGTSIGTRVAGTVHDLLRVSRNHRITTGQPVEAHLWSGTAMVNNVLVKDGYWQQTAQIHAGSRCLLFLRDTVEGILLQEYLPLIVNNDRLSYAEPIPQGDEYRPAHPMEGLRVSEVAKVVRRAKVSWVCGSCESEERCHVYCASTPTESR